MNELRLDEGFLGLTAQDHFLLLFLCGGGVCNTTATGKCECVLRVCHHRKGFEEEEKNLKRFSVILFYLFLLKPNCPDVIQRLDTLVCGCCLLCSCGLIMHEDPQQGVPLLFLLLNTAKAHTHTLSSTATHTHTD